MIKTRIKKYIFVFLGIIFLFATWDFAARAINLSFILPSVKATMIALFDLTKTEEFYKVIFKSLTRIISGLALGILLGITLAFLTHYVKEAKAFLSPLLTLIKSTPVASFIIVFWLIIGSDYVPSLIALLMVMPIVWQNLEDGFSSIDINLLEVCEIYNVGFIKRLKVLILPALKKYLIPAIITSSGLAWKSGIAAEIISYTKDSIGKNIMDAKAYFESEVVFAWTIVIVAFSIILEKALNLIGREASKND